MPTDDIRRESAPTLVLPETIRDEILAHARKGAPEEVCGVLAGECDDSDDLPERDADEAPDEHRVERRHAAEHRVENLHPAENVAETPRTRYEIDPREQLDLLETVEDAGREVVGFYHSHPRGPAAPSATDAAEATWPDRSYLIVSLGDDGDESDVSVGSWRWTGEAFVAEDLRIADEKSA